MTTGRPKSGARAPGPLSETYPPFPSTAATRPHTHTLTPTPTRAGCPPAPLPRWRVMPRATGAEDGHYSLESARVSYSEGSNGKLPVFPGVTARVALNHPRAVVATLRDGDAWRSPAAPVHGRRGPLVVGARAGRGWRGERRRAGPRRASARLAQGAAAVAARCVHARRWWASGDAAAHAARGGRGRAVPGPEPAPAHEQPRQALALYAVRAVAPALRWQPSDRRRTGRRVQQPGRTLTMPAPTPALALTLNLEPPSPALTTDPSPDPDPLPLTLNLTPSPTLTRRVQQPGLVPTRSAQEPAAGAARGQAAPSPNPNPNPGPIPNPNPSPSPNPDPDPDH
eukprot:scaffold44577_cov51-Phaeocystis_antarctica.AAC.4